MLVEKLIEVFCRTVAGVCAKNLKTAGEQLFGVLGLAGKAEKIGANVDFSI